MRWQKLYAIPDAEKRIGLILIFVLILPVSAFTIYELNRLNSNEQILQEIYKNQLDAVLFSVNQYSNDILDKWAGDLSELEKVDDSFALLEQFMFYNTSVREVIFFTNTVDSSKFYIEKYSNDMDIIICDSVFDNDFYKAVVENQELLEKQLSFIQNNYRKIEVMPSFGDTLVPMVFALKQPINSKTFVALMVNSQNFIEDVLAPKLQEIAREKFIMTSYVTQPTTRQTYFTDTLSLDEVGLSRPLWLLPNHFLGIALKGNSIDKISKARTKQNLAILLIIDAFLVIAIFLVYRNIRKEILLAKIKSEFVSNVSHEIRTPLAMISMFAETLYEGRVKQEEKKQTYYKMITDEAYRLTNTVNQILNFSKIESGKRKFDFKNIEVQEIIEKCLESYQRQLKMNGFKVTLKKSANLPQIKADENALTEALNNLINNAIKYSKEQKEIFINSYKKGQYVIITIQDFGIGIPSEHHKNIFNKFFRVPNHDIHDTKGTGLGLTMVKYIIEAHKGNVLLSSTENKGTTFSLQIPAIKT